MCDLILQQTATEIQHESNCLACPPNKLRVILSDFIVPLLPCKNENEPLMEKCRKGPLSCFVDAFLVPPLTMKTSIKMTEYKYIRGCCWGNATVNKQGLQLLMLFMSYIKHFESPYCWTGAVTCPHFLCLERSSRKKAESVPDVNQQPSRNEFGSRFLTLLFFPWLQTVT